SLAGSGSLLLFVTATCSHLLEEREWLKFVIHAQLKIFCTQPFDNAPTLIQHRDVGLNQLGFGANNIIRRISLNLPEYLLSRDHAEQNHHQENYSHNFADVTLPSAACLAPL